MLSAQNHLVLVLLDNGVMALLLLRRLLVLMGPAFHSPTPPTRPAAGADRWQGDQCSEGSAALFWFNAAPDGALSSPLSNHHRGVMH